MSENQLPSTHLLPAYERDRLLEKLAEIMDGSELTELSYVEGEIEVVLSKQVQAVAAPVALAPAPAAAAAPAPAAATADAPAAEAAPTAGFQVKAPMVGTAYMSPSPDAAPFVKVGDTVSEGQTLMIIEAMKVMNPLPSPKAGVIKEIITADAEPVEFDQVLMVIG